MRPCGARDPRTPMASARTPSRATGTYLIPPARRHHHHDPPNSSLFHDPIQGSLLPSVVPTVRPQEPDETVPDQPGRCRNQQRAARCERVTTPDHPVSARPDLVCSIRAEGHLDVPHGPLPATTRERRGLHFDVGRRPGPHLGLRTSLPFHTTHDRPWA
jgi:hypothetical protein